jgi:hypothetical protein
MVGILWYDLGVTLWDAAERELREDVRLVEELDV